METKIRRLAEGEFERNFPKPYTDPDRIVKSGTEGTDIGGSFRVYTDGDTPLNGRVYSSNPYVTAEEENFSGKEVFINFTAHMGGFYPGEKLEGHFFLVSDGYDLEVPFEFTVEEKLPSFGDAEVHDLNELYDLEKNDRRTAVSVFSSQDFKKLLIRHFPDSYLSYRALTKTMGYTPLALENFLCENSVKERIRLHVFPPKLDFYSVNEDVKESFRITRNTDGYVSLTFETDPDSFISLSKKQATDADFYGGTLEVPFFIKSNRLHKGVNTSHITIKGNGIFIEKQVLVSTYGKDEQIDPKRFKKKQVIVGGLKDYLDFRLRKTDTDAFLKSATDVSEFILSKNPADLFALLYRTMAQVVAGEKKQAIVTIAMLKEMITDKKSYEWAFLLYLCSLMDPDESYIDQITQEIEAIYKETDDPRIFWFLLFLRREYTENPLKRLGDIRKCIEKGNYSPILYAEAFDVLNAYPQYIGQLDSFTLGILRFGQRQGVLGRESVPFITGALSDLRDYSASVFDFVGKLYDKYDDDMLLQAIVSYLLRGRCIGKKYALWYKRGIEMDLNLTGIYENYMYCIDESDTDVLPQILEMYFSYDDSELPEEKREYLYANVIMYKERRPNIYDAYKPQIERYAIEKLQEGRIDDYLSVIYRDLYKRDFFDAELKEKLYALKDTLKVFCLSQESGKLSIYTRRLNREYVIDLKKHSAILPVKDEDFFTVLTNQNGIFCEKGLFYTEKLLPELNESQEKEEEPSVITPDTEEAFADHIICTKKYDEVSVSDVAGDLSLKNRPQEVVTFYIRWLIENSREEQAFSLMKEVNGFKVPENLLLRMATKVCESDDNDVFLSGVLVWLLEHYLSNKVTLDYLCEHYHGTTEELISVYKYARARGCEVAGLSERIIRQVIFEESVPAEIADVFMSYRCVKPDRGLILAYMTYFSDRYVRDEKTATDDDFFRYIRDLCVSGDGDNDAMRTALLKYYSTKNRLSDEDYSAADELLRDNLINGKSFSFYKKMDIRLIREFGLYEKVFIETHKEPGHSLTVTVYPGTDKEKILEMEEVYDGIYIASIILFRGESAEYRIADENGHEVKRGTAVNQDYPDGMTRSRFGLINEISEEEKNESASLADSIKEYIRLDLSSDDLFSMV